MLKLRFGNQIVNLIKDKKGAERPGHKYIKRIPLPGGGYKYIYEELKGRTRTEEILTGRQARARQPESFDPLTYKFGISEEEAKNIINFKFKGNAKTLKSIHDNYMNADRMSSQLGFYKEAALLIGIEIGEGWIHDINDAIYFLDDKYDSLVGLTDKKSLETKAMIERFVDHTRVLSDLETPKMNGKKVIEAVWNQSGETWTKTKSDLEYHSGRKIDSKQFQFVPVSAETGQDVVADYLLVDKNDGSTVDIFSLKWNSGRPISLKEGTYDTAVIGWLVNSGNESLRGLSNELKDIHDGVKNSIKKLALNSYDANHLRAAKMKNHLMNRLGLNVSPGKRTQDQIDLAADYTEMIIKRLHSVHNDPRSKDTILNVSTVDKNGNVKLLQVRASRLNKKMDQWLSQGIISIKTAVMSDGAYGNLNFSRVDPKTGKEVTFAAQEFRNSKNSSQLRASESFFTGLMEQIEGDNVNVTKILENNDAFRPTASKIKAVVDDLFKSTQTLERKKMNAKYIRKELTESGKVRYIYKETTPRTKKEEEAPSIRRNQFGSSVDSVDPAYKALFNEACQEIDEDSYTNINAGCSSVRFTKDVEVFHDVLDVPKELREQFADAAGLFNANNGKMGFCTSNFPDGVSEMVKKGAMLHEIGHAYFYGTLRIKHKKPLTSDAVDTKDKEQKASLKDSTKFVDKFGKIDKEIREMAEEKVTLSDVKGQDKELLLEQTIKAYMISEYATLNAEEHFAEAFSRYFIFPEQLRRKEKEVYDHFESFFQKYGE